MKTQMVAMHIGSLSNDTLVRVCELERQLRYFGFGNVTLEEQINKILTELDIAMEHIAKQEKPVEVKPGDLVSILGYGESFGKLAKFTNPATPFEVVSLGESDNVKFASVKIPNVSSPGYLTWKVPVACILKVLPPAIGSFKLVDGEQWVMRSDGWARATRNTSERRKGLLRDPRIVALEAMEKIQNPRIAEWQTAISMARTVRGLTSLDRIQVRSGRDRRKSL